MRKSCREINILIKFDPRVFFDQMWPANVFWSNLTCKCFFIKFDRRVFDIQKSDGCGHVWLCSGSPDRRECIHERFVALLVLYKPFISLFLIVVIWQFWYSEIYWPVFWEGVEVPQKRLGSARNNRNTSPKAAKRLWAEWKWIIADRPSTSPDG